MNEPKPQPRDIMSETPRTENVATFAPDDYHEMTELARQLERELAQSEEASLSVARKHHELATALTQAQARCAELEKDAARYGWLRSQMGKNLQETWKVIEELGAIACYTSDQDFDAAIDEALKEPR